MKRLSLLACSLAWAVPATAAEELAPTAGATPPAQTIVMPSSDVGRYQLLEAQFSIGTLSGPEGAERHLLRIDTSTGEVWIGKQTRYQDKKTGRTIQQRHWEPFEQYLEAAQPAVQPTIR